MQLVSSLVRHAHVRWCSLNLIEASLTRAGPLSQVVWRSETSLSMAPLLPVVPGRRGKLVATAEVCHQSWQLKVLTTNLPRGLVVPVIFGRG